MIIILRRLAQRAGLAGWVIAAFLAVIATAWMPDRAPEITAVPLILVAVLLGLFVGAVLHAPGSPEPLAVDDTGQGLEGRVLTPVRVVDRTVRDGGGRDATDGRWAQ